MATISSITSLSLASCGIFGTKKSEAICPTGGCTIRITGTSSRLPATSAMPKRSKRRKSPVETASITITAEANTPQNCETPRK
ncbi:hypothetical protein ACVI1L_003237 [Bradyrhizobium sp. USDA 4516]